MQSEAGETMANIFETANNAAQKIQKEYENRDAIDVDVIP